MVCRVFGPNRCQLVGPNRCPLKGLQKGFVDGGGNSGKEQLRTYVVMVDLFFRNNPAITALAAHASRSLKAEPF